MATEEDQTDIKVDKLTLEDVIQSCGEFNRFQYINYFFLNFIPVVSGMITYYYVYGVADIHYQCRQSSVDNSTQNPDQCQCPLKQWTYDRSIFGHTFTEDGNFICSRRFLKSWVATVYQIGGITVLITGRFSDKIGRRKMIQILTIGLLLTTSVTQLVMQFAPLNFNVIFGLLLLNQFLSAIDTFSLVFLLLMELTTSRHTSLAGNLAMVSFSVGEMVVTLFAYVSRHWLLLKWLITSLIALSIPYLYFVPESPYWLYSNHIYIQLEHQLRRIAQMNHRPELVWFNQYQKLIAKPRPLITIRTVTKRSILKYLPKIFLSCFIGVLAMALYIKISYGLSAMDSINPYVNIVIGAIVESIGYISSSIMITTVAGRKYSLILYTLITAICVVILPFLSLKHSSLLTVMLIIVAQLGKLTISGALSISWIYVPELFPVGIRATVNGLFVLFTRFGAIAAPIIDTSLPEKYLSITTYVYAALAILMILLIFVFLPETRNRSFEDDFPIKRSSMTPVSVQ
ncbi:unnamed protein product [Didymodactylos carnosus]|uniref:Major facilitator superfamily (MFS) profile domain-containing protein n=1 Tax=Didymodactylos carnosus TaxID=1234261 RepID=A0A8S2ES89_9BILA|nr:unnamed protein product [Didymodactylos carnosus]CAF4048794.1 unnamed protein product [Didymodactylos carnosus]